MRRHMPFLINLCTVLAFVVLVPLSAQAQAVASAGRIVLAAGSVQLVRGGAVSPARGGLDLRAGDVIRTAPGSSAQLWFQDGGMVAVREKSEFRIESYSYSKDARPASMSNVTTLVKGGARVMTGAIAKANPDAIKVNTRVATIGIRGTGFDLLDCIDQCFQDTGALANPGLYGAVYEGQVVITNQAGESDLLVSQVFYVASAVSPVVRLPVQPNFLAEPAAEGGMGKSTEAVEAPDAPIEAPAAPVQIVQSAPVETVAQVRLPPPQQADVLSVPTVIFNKTDQGNGSPLDSTVSSLSFQSAEYNPVTSERNVENFIRGMKATYTDGNLVAVTYPPIPNFLGYVIKGYTARQLEGGSDQSVVAWGRWADGTLLIGGWSGSPNRITPLTLNANQGFHWLVGDTSKTLPTGGVYEFNLIGATVPTEARADAAGGWAVTGGKLTADLLAAKLSGTLNLYLNRDQLYGFFDMKFNSTSALVAGSQIGIATAVDRTGGSINICTATCNGLGTVMFYGNNPAKPASHVGMSYDFNTGDYFVQGVAVFNR